MTGTAPSSISPAQQANDAGLAALRQGDFAAAIAHLRAATAADPAAGPLWRNLAHACRLAGDDSGERAALERALALDRTDFAAQLRTAQLLQRLGEESAALIAWNGVFQLAEGLPQISPPLRAELDAGRGYCAELEVRLGQAVDAALGGALGMLDETGQRRMRAFADIALGRRAVFHNRCAGVYYPFLPADEFFDRRHFPWLDTLEAGARDVRAELAGLLAASEEVLRPYVRQDEGTPENDWSGLDGSLDWGACFLWEFGVPNQPVLDRCPKTAALLERLPLMRVPGRAPNAFFSLLRAGSRIPPHTGVTNTRAIVHLALDIPPDCGFRVGGETRQWVAGKAFAFDDTIDHEAWNNSARRRAILIIDTWNPHLSPGERDAVARYFQTSDQALGGAGERGFRGS